MSLKNPRGETLPVPVTIAVLNRLAALAVKLNRPSQDVARDVFEIGLSEMERP